MPFSKHHVDEVGLVRLLCAVLAAIVVVDAVSVGAPGLALLAVPFVIAAFRFRRGGVGGTVLLAVCGVGYAAIGLNYAVATGIDAPWGDLLFAYPGTAIAVAIAGLVVHHRMHLTHQHA